MTDAIQCGIWKRGASRAIWYLESFFTKGLGKMLHLVYDASGFVGRSSAMIYCDATGFSGTAEPF